MSNSRRRVAVIDAETDPFRRGRVPQPFLWGYYDGRDYKEFAKGEDLAAFLRDRDEIIYAHNGGKFDFHYLLPYLDEYSDMSIINGRIARMYIGLAELRDSFLLMPEPLAAYQKDVIDYATFEPGQRDYEKNKRKISAYLQSDCLYLHQMVSAFIAKFGLHLTLPGAAMAHWRRVEKREELEPIEETNREFYQRFAPFYYGGRVQCFQSGIIDTDFAVYDINSAYPFAMLNMHPASRTYTRDDHYVSNADFYRIRCISAGVFPYRSLDASEDYGLTFPHDDAMREYFVTGWEYKAAIDTKCIREIKILESVSFARHTTFQAYINEFWEERKTAKEAGDVLGDLFAKRMMNALYGKWAANPDNYSTYIVCPQSDIPGLANAPEDAPYHLGGIIGPWALAQKGLDENQARYYNVATGASITGFVRAMVWRAIHSTNNAARKAGLKYGVLYCDTDGIAAETKGSGVDLGSALGQWKLEGRFDRAGIAGKKLYIFRGAKGEKGKDGARLYKTASKGVRLTHAELWRVAAGGSVDYEPEVPTYSVHKAPHFTNRTVRRTA